jgi:hypothetical protein
MKFVTVSIHVGDTMIGRVIVSSLYEADKLWSKWCQLRYSRNESLGCTEFK